MAVFVCILGEGRKKKASPSELFLSLIRFRIVSFASQAESQLFGVAFNPVPSVNAEIREMTLDQITSWVFNDDIVSRLSKSNVQKLIQQVIELRYV